MLKTDYFLFKFSQSPCSSMKKFFWDILYFITHLKSVKLLCEMFQTLLTCKNKNEYTMWPFDLVTLWPVHSLTCWVFTFLKHFLPCQGLLPRQVICTVTSKLDLAWKITPNWYIKYHNLPIGSKVMERSSSMSADLYSDLPWLNLLQTQETRQNRQLCSLCLLNRV